MGNNVVEETPTSNGFDGSETTIEIKIKTLDSQTYTLRVDKQMPVPTLKEQIASVTGVLSEQQRLICRGKVLKDDQLLSAYHVEDGHTLHMVVRQPLPPSESLLNNSVSEPNSSSSQGFSHQTTPRVVIETFSLSMRGDGVPPEMNRIVSAVLGSIGLSNMVRGSSVPEVREHGQLRQESTSGANNLVDPNQHQSVEAGSYGSLGQSTASSLGSMAPPIIPDSLTTLSRYINHMRSEFVAVAKDRGIAVQAPFEHASEGLGSNSAINSEMIQEGLPTPASLADVVLSTRQILVEAAGECLLHLARLLENQVNVTDPPSAWRTGVLFQHLGLSANGPRQQGPTNYHGININININIVSASETQNIQHSNRESVVDFLRSAFPVGDISLEDASILEAPVPEHETTSNAVVDIQESESGASDEGIFLSNILRQIMPHISQPIYAAESISEHTRFPDSSTQSMNCVVPGTSRRQSDSEADAPGPKRQKTERHLLN